MGDSNWARFGHHKAYDDEKISITKPVVTKKFQSPSL
jgi:hypothetical protein